MEGRIYSCDLISGRPGRCGPAGEVYYGVDFAGVAAAGSGGGLLGESAGGVGVFDFVLLQGEVDEQGFADDGFAWDEAPVAAVFTVVAVVAEDEVVAGGDDERLALCANNSHLRIENGHAANLVLSYEKSNSFNIYSPAMTAYLG